MTISKNKILIILTGFLLGIQTIYLHFNKPLQKEDTNLVILQNKDKYEEQLNKKQKLIKESNLFKILQTDLKISKYATIEPVFIWDKNDKTKHNLQNKTYFDSTYLANLILYHNQIRDIYEYTKNTTIIESFRKMITTIDTINKETPNIVNEKDMVLVKEILKNFKDFTNTLDSSIIEINEFDNKIFQFLKTLKKNENINLSSEQFAQRTIKEVSLIIEMLMKSNNLYINVSNNSTGEPFEKFQGFLSIYNQTYELYASLITRYNQEAEKSDNINTWFITISTLFIIFIAFFKDFRQSE